MMIIISAFLCIAHASNFVFVCDTQFIAIFGLVEQSTFILFLATLSFKCNIDF